MAISSINFAKSSGGSFAHNDRTEKEPDYLLPVEHRLENECNRSASEAQKMLTDLFENAKENYSKTYGQKFQTKFENVHWEAVVNLNKEHTIKDVERLVREIEKETGFTAVQISIHRDEGHINEKTGHPIYNLHAHVNFFTLNPETGQQLYRRSISNSEREKIRKEHGIPDGEKIPKHLTAVMDKEKLSKLQDITAEVLGMERGQKGSKAVRLGHKQHRAVEQEKEKLLEKIDELQKENAELRYAFRAAQKRISSLEGIDAEQKKELHRLNTEINKTADNGDKSRKIAELEAKIERLEAKPEPVGIDVPDKEQINKIGERLQRVANYTADQIIETSSIERKGVLGTKKEIDVPTLRDNITTVLNQHNELHRETWGIIKKLNEVKEKFLDGAKNVVESSKTALKTIFSLGEGKSLSEEKKGVETPEEAKERIQKFLAEQKAKKQSKGMSR
ncbi:MAG: hypothetical protein RBT70_10145 [Alphaproteobacteria bacterium]|jgi:hypothetical protein|nr:hypothetical protein [Alphaproteobacteria bacterium]